MAKGKRKQAMLDETPTPAARAAKLRRERYGPSQSIEQAFLEATAVFGLNQGTDNLLVASVSNPQLEPEVANDILQSMRYGIQTREITPLMEVVRLHPEAPQVVRNATETFRTAAAARNSASRFSLPDTSSNRDIHHLVSQQLPVGPAYETRPAQPVRADDVAQHGFEPYAPVGPPPRAPSPVNEPAYGNHHPVIPGEFTDIQARYTEGLEELRRKRDAQQMLNKWHEDTGALGLEDVEIVEEEILGFMP